MIKYPEAAIHMTDDTRWNELYMMYPHRYIQALKKYFPLLKDKAEPEVIQLVYNELVLNE